MEYLHNGGFFITEGDEVSKNIYERYEYLSSLTNDNIQELWEDLADDTLEKLKEAVEVIKYYENVKNYDACESGSIYHYLWEEQEEVGLRAREFLKGLE